MAEPVHVGVAGWALPSPSYEPRPGFAPRLPQARFGEGGSHLERYARVYTAAEINSTFYRIFDNTAAGFAQGNALGLIDRLAAPGLG